MSDEKVETRNSNKMLDAESQKENGKRKVTIICPKCKKSKEIDVPENVLRDDNLTNIQIPEGLVCEHSFQAFIDRQFKVRGYQKPDFEAKNNTKKGKDEKKGEDQALSLAQEKIMTDKEIYEEFWELIYDDNIEFKEFIKNDERRRSKRD